MTLIKFFDLVGFQEIFHFAYQAHCRQPKLGHYSMMVGILMLLFIGFNRIWHFVYVRLHALLCGLFKLTRLPAAILTLGVADQEPKRKIQSFSLSDTLRMGNTGQIPS